MRFRLSVVVDVVLRALGLRRSTQLSLVTSQPPTRSAVDAIVANVVESLVEHGGSPKAGELTGAESYSFSVESIFRDES